MPMFILREDQTLLFVVQPRRGIHPPVKMVDHPRPISLP